MRLNQYLSRAGKGTRRSVERLIRAGRVKVDGRPAELTTRVRAGYSRVTLDGEPVVLPANFTYVVLHKPRGYTVTRSDRRAAATVYQLLPPRWRSLAYVGRLDRESEGLLLFTDDGNLAWRLMRPEFEVEREYLVDLRVAPEPAATARLKSGVRLPDGHLARARRLRLLVAGGRPRLQVVLCEGKKHEVRHLCRALGAPAKRLVRVRFGPVRLGALPSGACRRLRPREVAALAKSAAPPKKALP